MRLRCTRGHLITDGQSFGLNKKIGDRCKCGATLGLDPDLVKVIGAGDNIKKIRTIKSAVAMIDSGWAEMHEGRWNIPSGERDATVSESKLLTKALTLINQGKAV